MVRMLIHRSFCVIAMASFIPVGPAFSEEKKPLLPLEITAAKVAEAPTLDGIPHDKVWAESKTHVIRMEKVGEGAGRESDVAMAALHTDSEVFFLFQWFDETCDEAHKPWSWNKDKNAYEAGTQEEDIFSVSFPIKGLFTGIMTSPVECTWDVWHWKAARTNPAGYAMDKYHVYTLKKPEGKAKSFETRGGKLIWIARPEDAGDSPQAEQKAPEARQGDTVPQFIAGTPSGSAADVRAKGVWRNGLWSLEMGRKLDTGHPDDAAIPIGKPIRMALAVFDHTEHEQHSVSKVLSLTLQP